MILTKARVLTFKSIDDSSEVSIDRNVTILVGQNESGKTAFLQALHKSVSVESGVSFNITEDYPRKDLNQYQREHANNPAVVTELTYTLTDQEISAINADLGFNLLGSLSFTHNHRYDGGETITLSVPEKSYVSHLIEQAKVTTETKEAIKNAGTIKEMTQILEGLDLNNEEPRIS